VFNFIPFFLVHVQHDFLGRFALDGLSEERRSDGLDFVDFGGLG
jgi:hypothetical protein